MVSGCELVMTRYGGWGCRLGMVLVMTRYGDCVLFLPVWIKTTLDLFTNFYMLIRLNIRSMKNKQLFILYHLLVRKDSRIAWSLLKIVSIGALSLDDDAEHVSPISKTESRHSSTLLAWSWLMFCSSSAKSNKGSTISITCSGKAVETYLWMFRLSLKIASVGLLQMNNSNNTIPKL